MRKIWITSDYHVNHSNLCRGSSKWEDKTGCRDFENPQEMEKVIVQKFNERVEPDDFVYNLGDIIFGDVNYLPTFLNKLLCKNIALIYGNHDHKIRKTVRLQKLFYGCYEDMWFEIGAGESCYLSHYPDYTSLPLIVGTMHLFGHEHCNKEDNKSEWMLDVGVDGSWYGHEKFAPWSLDEVLNVMHNIKSPVSHKF